VGNLQQKVENLAGDRIGGVSVFQAEPSIFLNVEAFILDFLADTPSLVGQLKDLLVLEGEIGDPAEACSLGLAWLLWIWLAFHTLQDTDRMFLLLRIGVGDVVDPAVLLAGLALRTAEEGEVVFRRKRQKRFKFLVNERVSPSLCTIRYFQLYCSQMLIVGPPAKRESKLKQMGKRGNSACSRSVKR
jgi:hypothetical protein